MTYTFKFGRQKIFVSLKRSAGRPKKTFFTRFQEYSAHLIKLAKDRRHTGHPVSRVFRQILESRHIKKFFGINLMMLTILNNIIVSPATNLAGNLVEEITVISPKIIQLTTENSTRFPIEKIKISQGYRTYHPAIDFAAAAGSPVYPIMEGKVENIASQRLGYGNYLIINHGSDLKSLYAHLSKITVKQNEEVNKDTIIGTIGASGWATGPHLHLEVYKDGRTFNPLTILR